MFVVHRFFSLKSYKQFADSYKPICYAEDIFNIFSWTKKKAWSERE